MYDPLYEPKGPPIDEPIDKVSEWIEDHAYEIYQDLINDPMFIDALQHELDGDEKKNVAYVMDAILDTYPNLRDWFMEHGSELYYRR